MNRETVTKEKEYTDGIRLNRDGASGKWDNFWYHYKWPLIGFLIFAIIFGVCIAQSCSREKEDVMLLYAGPVAMTPHRTEQFNEIMNTVMPRDLDGNGEKHATVSTYLIYSEEQIKAMESKTDAEGNPQQVDKNFNTSEYKTYTSLIQYGECSVLFLDPWLYESLQSNENQPLQNLSELFVDLPQGTLADGFGVRLGDTALYARYEVLQMLPADTVICLSRSYVLGANANEERYAREKEMFAAIVDGDLKD